MLFRVNSTLLKLSQYIEVLPCYWFSLRAARKEVVPIKMAYNSYQSTGFDANQTPLIIMHGLFGSKNNWNSLCKAYQKTLNIRVYSLDARNHGESPHTPEHSYQHLAADIKQFMVDFDITKVKLLGHSMGGRAMMYFALKHPELVEKLVVVDITPHYKAPSLDSMTPLFEFMSKVHMPRNGTIAEARQQVDRQLATRITDRLLRTFLVTNLVQKSDGTHAWRINLSSLLMNYKTNIAQFPDMPRITYTGPTLFVGGAKSDYIPRDSEPQLREKFPAAEVKYISGAGHWLHSEKSHDFLKLSVEFLKDNSGQHAEATAATVQPLKK